MARASMLEASRPLLVTLVGALAACSVSTSSSEHAETLGDQVTAAQCAAAKPWGEWIAYATGAVVTYGGADYECLQAHTSEPGWEPSAVPALWEPVHCASTTSASSSSSSSSSSGAGGSHTGSTSTTTSTSTGSTSTSTSTSSTSTSTSSGGSTCDPSAWVYMGSDANACDGHVGESCGWTTTNLGQGYHCQTVSWGTGCEQGGASCPTGSSSSSSSTSSTSTSSSSSSGTTSSSSSSSSSSTSTSSSGGHPGGGLVFSPYKDTSINMNWNTDVITTTVPGASTSLATDLVQNGGKTISLAFATGECGSENWGGVAGDAMATANVKLLSQAGVNYIVSTGGAAGIFSCGSDAGMTTFINRWASSNLIGVDFDIEAGQSQAQINDIIARIKTAHGAYPNLRFSLTLATLAVSQSGSSKAQSLGSAAQDSFNVYGDWAMAAVKSTLGFSGASSWPSYVTVNLMTMDFGSASNGVCVVNGSICDMGQSSLQAAYNLHDHWGVPYGNIELTPMLGGNDVSSEQFTLGNADTVAAFALSQGLAGVHYWSYDRDIDCAAGSASATCNSMGNGYAGAHGYLKRFLADGLH